MSNELIRELVEALRSLDGCYCEAGLSLSHGERAAHRAALISARSTLAKARAYLETGGWTRVEDGLPKHDRRNEPPLRIWVSMNGETPWKYLYVQGDDPSGQFTHWRYAESTPESPKG